MNEWWNNLPDYVKATIIFWTIYAPFIPIGARIIRGPKHERSKISRNRR